MSDFLEWVEDPQRLDEIINGDEGRYGVVIDFTAPAWCRPCQQFAPHFEAAAKSSRLLSDTIGRVKYVAVDVDESHISDAFGVKGVPTVMLYVEGAFVQTLSKRTAPSLMNEIREGIANFYSGR